LLPVSQNPLLLSLLAFGAVLRRLVFGCNEFLY